MATYRNGVPVVSLDEVEVPTSPVDPGFTVMDAPGPGDPGVSAGYGTLPGDNGRLGVAPPSRRGPKGGV